MAHGHVEDALLAGVGVGDVDVVVCEDIADDVAVELVPLCLQFPTSHTKAVVKPGCGESSLHLSVGVGSNCAATTAAVLPTTMAYDGPPLSLAEVGLERGDEGATLPTDFDDGAAECTLEGAASLPTDLVGCPGTDVTGAALAPTECVALLNSCQLLKKVQQADQQPQVGLRHHGQNEMQYEQIYKKLEAVKLEALQGKENGLSSKPATNLEE